MPEFDGALIADVVGGGGGRLVSARAGIRRSCRACRESPDRGHRLLDAETLRVSAAWWNPTSRVRNSTSWSGPKLCGGPNLRLRC